MDLKSDEPNLIEVTDEMIAKYVKWIDIGEKIEKEVESKEIIKNNAFAKLGIAWATLMVHYREVKDGDGFFEEKGNLRDMLITRMGVETEVRISESRFYQIIKPYTTLNQLFPEEFPLEFGDDCSPISDIPQYTLWKGLDYTKKLLRGDWFQENKKLVWNRLIEFGNLWVEQMKGGSEVSERDRDPGRLNLRSVDQFFSVLIGEPMKDGEADECEYPVLSDDWSPQKKKKKQKKAMSSPPKTVDDSGVLEMELKQTKALLARSERVLRAHQRGLEVEEKDEEKEEESATESEEEGRVKTKSRKRKSTGSKEDRGLKAFGDQVKKEKNLKKLYEIQLNLAKFISGELTGPQFKKLAQRNLVLS